MNVIRTITITLILALVAAPALAAPAAVTFPPTAKVDGDRVTLYDLAADAAHLHPQLQKALKDQVVMSAPPLGGRSQITAPRIKAMWRQAKLNGITVLIPPMITVERASQTVTAQDLADIYRQALTRRLGHRAASADIRGVRADRDYVLPSGRLTTRVSFFGDEVVGKVPASIDLIVDGRRMRRVRVVGQVDLYTEVAVAARTLGRHQIIEHEDVELKRVNLAGAGKAVITDPARVVGMKTRGVVNAGEPLDMTQLERMPLIKKGDVVSMICTGAGLKISAKGKAEQTGYNDGRIRLTNLSTKREVWGRVLDSGTVLVEF